MEKLVEAISILASKLEMPVSNVASILVRQASIDFVVTSIQYLVIFALSWLWVKKFSKVDWERTDSPAITLMFLLTGLILAILVMAAFLYLPDYAASIINPKYWALEEITRMLHK